MARKFGDLDQYWQPGLTLTVLGREYTLPLPSAELGLWCRRMAEVAGQVDAASTEQEMQAAVEAVEALPELPGQMDLPQRMLGDVYDQMATDEVPDPYVQYCGQTAYVWVVGGEQAAERFWTSGGHPEAPSPAANRATKRAAKTAKKTSTAAATGTRTRASTSGTSSPKKSATNGAAKRTRGRTS